MVGCVGQGREWGLCPGDTEGVSVRGTAGHTTDRCVQPRGRDQEGNKAVELSLKEINYCAHGDECLFDEKGFMVTVFGPNVLGVTLRRRRSVSNVQQKRRRLRE